MPQTTSPIPGWTILILIAAWLLVAFLARRIGLKEYGWKLGLIAATIAFGAVVCSMGTPKWGIDLRGGTILIYQVDKERTAESMAEAEEDGESASSPSSAVDMDSLIQSLGKRINPTGVKEIVLRPYGSDQVEIIIPEVSGPETELIKDIIKKTGFLKFRILANRIRDPRVWEAGELALASPEDAIRRNRFVSDGVEIVGEWVEIGRAETNDGSLGQYRVDLQGVLTRELVPGRLEGLVRVDDDQNVEGKHLRAVQESRDDDGSPCVTFQTTSEGSVLFGSLTGMNLPNEANGTRARLGIVLDGVLLSAPNIQSRISSRGEISGGFSKTEVEKLVRILRAGRLPAILQPEPISENNISPLLGVDTIRKGTWAIGASLVAVLVFMAIYYHFSGLVACMALGLNLLLIVALMIAIDAAFTLPGLAGLVLTVGMSVDANVLIFERIREELNRGAALRMAIRNGFSKATTTIVDANLTTLITAFVLYWIGTDQIKGFGITLILGILMSMFTAIFCARVLFDIAERRRWITKLSMSQLVQNTNIQFVAMRKIAAVVSVIVIAIGLTGAFMRGAKLYDIDFTGGTSIQAMLTESMPIEDVRERVKDIADDVWVTQMNPEGRTPQTVYKIDTSLPKLEELQTRVAEAFSLDGKQLLMLHSMEFTPPQELQATQTSSRWTPADFALAAMPLSGAVAGPQDAAAPAAEASDESASGANSPATDQNTAMSEQGQGTESKPSGESKDAAAETEAPSSGEEPSLGDTDPTENGAFQSESTLTLDEAMNARTVNEQLRLAAKAAELPEPNISLNAEGWDQVSMHRFQEWTVKFSTPPDETQELLSSLQSSISGVPVWLSANMIGSKVAGDMKMRAIAAMAVSLLAIVAYLWVRFQHVTYGLAAVIALVHDVLVTLGAIALSAWFAKSCGFLLIEEFKISLPMVAAFLTVIGYSLNDTIVVFDRIREVKAKSPELTSEMINLSINQTLSRTLLTSLTTLIVVLILYVFGGDGIHGFAFSLLIGVVVGTYSSIFVASPALLAMTQMSARKKAKA